MQARTANSFEGYCRAVQEVFFPVVVDGMRTPVSTRLRRRQAGAFAVTEGLVYHPDPIRGSRNASSIEQRAEDQFILIGPQTGSLVYRQFGREAMLEPGSAVLLNTRIPYEFERRTSGAFMCHQLPGQMVRQMMPEPERFCAVPIATSRGSGAVALRYLETVWHEIDALSESERDFLLSNALRLVSAACGGRQSEYRPTSPRKLYDRAVTLIEAHLHRPGLAASAVAAELGVTAGHLHSTFQEQGTTVGRTILQRRLEMCRQELARGASVTDTAYRWGFGDASSFSRAFKRFYGIPPRQVRAD
ncbi:helix-turn-helix domain-containing protein [Aquamicrobium sp. LC103]|uniref:helix-turn-helix domain-containing protein n=1 Tax=Aquamicrobium sp. LC103 TaxID=1120658 RepID=UPI00069A1FA8|nr:helix-turn-helix domain-containing protein [Aquamicrobium sp. LC103]TKT74475.1 helix-turn-helix domain-containing protein [Aquamicrobium sp. LC103]